MIMQAREIPRVMESLSALKIDKVWFKGFTEAGLCTPIARWVEKTDYDNYLIVSDDVIATQGAFDVVESGLERRTVFTGWCNVAPGMNHADMRFVSIIGARSFFQVTHLLPPLHTITTDLRLRSLPTIDEVRSKHGEFETKVVSGCFVGMRRALWQRFPFQVARSIFGKDKGFGFDIKLTNRLKDAGIKMYSHSDAFFYHLASKANWIVGRAKPAVIFEPGARTPVTISPLTG
jgi:hypothetical protein